MTKKRNASGCYGSMGASSDSRFLFELTSEFLFQFRYCMDLEEMSGPLNDKM